MSENENRKGPGVFYAVVGVATLVVAIIGATFAYFSASDQTGANAIQGQSLNITEANLDINVSQVTFTGHTVTTNLAPALVGSGINSPAALTYTEVQAMVNAMCEETNKYTGCHVWKIDATNNGADPIQHANIWLRLAVTPTRETGGDKSQWGYAIFTTEGNVATAGTTALDDVAYPTVASTANPAFGNHGSLATDITGKNLDIHNDASIGANTTVTYYLLVYLNDDGLVQNATTPSAGSEEPHVDASSDARASYAGSVLFEAMGGQVKASFTVPNA